MDRTFRWTPLLLVALVPATAAPLRAEPPRASPQAASSAALRSRFVFEARVEVSAPQVVGQSAHGLRRIVPITGGKVEGPRLQAKVLAGGADWQYVRPDGVLEVDARYTLQATDGSLIMIHNHGLRRGPKDVIDKLTRGEQVDPSLYYFRTTAEFEAPAESPHAWLNGSIFVGVAERQPGAALIRFYQVD